MTGGTIPKAVPAIAEFSGKYCCCRKYPANYGFPTGVIAVVTGGWTTRVCGPSSTLWPTNCGFEIDTLGDPDGINPDGCCPTGLNGNSWTTGGNSCLIISYLMICCALGWVMIYLS